MARIALVLLSVAFMAGASTEDAQAEPIIQTVVGGEPPNGFYSPQSFVVRPNGRILVAAGNEIFESDELGGFHVLYGSPERGSACYARPLVFGQPALGQCLGIDWGGRIALLPNGEIVYTATWYDQVMRIDSEGILRHLAGAGETSLDHNVEGDGVATAVKLDNPYGIAAISNDTVLITEPGSNRIRKIHDGQITTVAGAGPPFVGQPAGDPENIAGFSGDGGPALEASLDYPKDLDLLADGSLIFTDWQNCRVRRIGLDGQISTVAGSASCPGRLSDSGPRLDNEGGFATEVVMQRAPSDITADSSGGFYWAQDEFSAVRHVDSQGRVTTPIGTGFNGFEGDNCPASIVPIDFPNDVEVAPSGQLFFIDRYTWSNGAIVRALGEGTPSTKTCTAIGYTGESGVDSFEGSRFTDIMLGNGGSDALDGGAFQDRLSGGAGADKLSGGKGSDRLEGGPGKDLIDCGPGFDTAIRTPGDKYIGCERLK